MSLRQSSSNAWPATTPSSDEAREGDRASAGRSGLERGTSETPEVCSNGRRGLDVLPLIEPGFLRGLSPTPATQFVSVLVRQARTGLTVRAPVPNSNAEGVEHQSPASRSARWVHDRRNAAYPNGVPQHAWVGCETPSGYCCMLVTDTQGALRDLGL